LGKKITLVVLPKLLASLGEGGAGDTARQQIDSPKGRCIEVMDVALDYSPPGPVVAERVATMGVNFHQCFRMETGTFQPEGLSARTGAYF